MPFLFRGEQRAAMQKAVKILNKLSAWDINIGNLSPRSKLSRTKLLPTTGGPPTPSAFATALELLLVQQLARTGTFQNVPNS